MDDDGRMSDTSSGRNRPPRHAPSTMGDPDTTGEVAPISGSHIRPQLRCNACWEPILPDAQSAETCYRTSCGHLFCEKCAYKHFGQGRLQCPACRVG
ncbi:Zinc ion binding protein [Phytophthora megakarya]|uniref:Zinc ion binding protein n=1 Tax=Phytophthora megakarya TaxID=4795 RepID=A0A225V855_9STRA|nr:Zinc ion binding protein [Phytophthora megakarya]